MQGDAFFLQDVALLRRQFGAGEHGGEGFEPGQEMQARAAELGVIGEKYAAFRAFHDQPLGLHDLRILVEGRALIDRGS